MLSTVNQIIKCLTIPFFAISAASFLCMLFLRRKEAILLALFVFFMILWRLIFPISSSRNCASFLILGFVLIAFFAKIFRHEKRPRRIAAVLFAGILFFNIVKLNASFRNTYVSDIQDSIETLLRNDTDVSVFIVEKDFKRFRDSTQPERQHELSDPSAIHDNLLALYTSYCFWTDDAYFIFPEKNDSTRNSKVVSAFLKNNNIAFRKIQQYYTNYRKKAVYSVYLLPKYNPAISLDAGRFDSLNHLRDIFLLSNQKDNASIRNIFDQGTLKAYSSEFDSFVIQCQNSLYWFVGSNIPNKTEFIYQLHTDRPDLLPRHRIIHGFDNQGFSAGGPNEMQKIGNYRVFAKPVPDQYPINYITVGFNTDGKVTWFDLFRPNQI